MLVSLLPVRTEQENKLLIHTHEVLKTINHPQKEHNVELFLNGALVLPSFLIKPLVYGKLCDCGFNIQTEGESDDDSVMKKLSIKNSSKKNRTN